MLPGESEKNKVSQRERRITCNVQSHLGTYSLLVDRKKSFSKHESRRQRGERQKCVLAPYLHNM